MIDAHVQEHRPGTFPLYSLALPFSERRALLLLGDGSMFAVAVGVAALLVSLLHTPLHHDMSWIVPQLTWVAGLILLWTVLLIVNECYNLQIASRQMKIMSSIALATAELGLIYLVTFFFFGRASIFADTLLSIGTVPRLLPVIFIGSAGLLLVVWRFCYIRIFTSPGLRRRAVLVGIDDTCAHLVRAIQERSQDYTIIGVLTDPTNVVGDWNLPVLGDLTQVHRVVERSGVNEIILAQRAAMTDELSLSIFACHERGVMVRPLLTLYEELTGRVPVESVGRHEFPIPLWNDRLPTMHQLAKRGLDLLLGTIGLVVLALLFPVVALAIYLDNPGPIFYRQVRVGKGGTTFQIMKFRSMRVNAEHTGQAVWATQGDPRVTRVGRLLRSSRIDELPQILNVIRGDMSFVGPRPERPEFVAQLQQTIPFYRTRLSVRPGLTGWAQVQYRYGNTTQDALIKLQHDLYYIKHQSIVLDLLILLRTIKVVLTFSGI